MSKLFENLKVGDTVFVVHQKRRGDKEHRTESLPVVRVGRKFGYIEHYGREKAFRLDCGASDDGDHRTRCNGYGFDVYVCEHDWRKKQFVEHEQARLWERIKSPSYGIITLPHDSVVAIHKILDGTLKGWRVMSEKAWPVSEFYDLVCNHCGWKCNSNVECLTYGDRCPKCEETCPGDEGEMKEISKDE